MRDLTNGRLSYLLGGGNFGEEGGGFLVEEEVGVGMGTEDGGRARGGNRTFEGVSNGFGLAPFRDHANEASGPHQSGDGDGVGVLGDGRDVRKGSFVDLLLAASGVELDDLNGHGVVEFGHMGVVEGDMTVFSDAEATEVDRGFV